MSDHLLLIGIFTILLWIFVLRPWFEERQQRQAERIKSERERRGYLKWWESTGRHQWEELNKDLERLAERTATKTWLQEAYDDGAEAFSTGKWRNDNPFLLSLEDFRYWNNGFVAASNLSRTYVSNLSVKTATTKGGFNFCRSDGERFFLVYNDDGSAVLYAGADRNTPPQTCIVTAPAIASFYSGNLIMPRLAG